jgi:DNA-binding MarR family transcriptional regulator
MDDPFGRVETEMVVLARRIENASRRSTIHRRMDRAAYLIARTLDESGPSSVNEIAKLLALDGSTVTRQLAAMQTRGFVTRSIDPDDGRAWIISLTETGRSEMLDVSEARRLRFAEFLDDWAPQDVAELGRLLEQFNRSLEAFRAAPLSSETAANVPASVAPRSDHRRSVLPSRRHR